MSVISFPDRGHWGDAQWRGNCSGHVYAHLFDLLRPRTFIDPMMGSGTSIDVARERGIDALGLDLHQGFNILRDRLRDQVPAHWTGGADLTFSHPPYHDMVTYSGAVWGDAHPDDLSRCADVDDFLDKLAQAVLNQRDATRDGGVYGVLLGDLRRNGAYHALTSDLQAYLPRRERRAIIIKAQHNTQSDRRAYGQLRFGRVTHETILLYERLRGDTYFALACAVNQQRRVSQGTWRAVVRHAITGLGNRFTVQDVYEAVYAAAPDRVQQAEHWKAKVRQVLQRLEELSGEGRGVWCRAA